MRNQLIQFQIVNGQDGTRTVHMRCTMGELADKLRECEFDRVDQDYVLIIAHGESVDTMEASRFPLMHVKKFVELYSLSEVA